MIRSVKAASDAVGADAHIGPAEQAVFAEICGEFATSGRADVGIGPYIFPEGFRKKTRTQTGEAFAFR